MKDVGVMGETEVKAGWKDGGIRIERNVEDGPSAVESWTVNTTTGHLVVVHTVDLPQGPKLEIIRVYRRL